MIKILFVCHGNICRSPMAQYIFQYLVDSAGRHDDFYIDSAAVSSEEIGNDIYPGAKRILDKYHIPYSRHRARRMDRDDYDKYDYIIGMDQSNLSRILYCVDSDPKGKCSLLLDWTDSPRNIKDPWYSDDFEGAYEDILMGCKALLEKL